MIRGTTPTHTFNIPFNVQLISKLRILYSQDDVLILAKNMEDCVISDNSISVTLTQEDTLSFNAKKNVEIQIRILTVENKALASIPKKVSVLKLLENEVLR